MDQYHRHDAYEIYLFIHGNTNMYLEHSCYHLELGDLLVISPSEMHRAVCLDNQLYERIGINIKKSVFERLSSKRTNLLSCFESHTLGQKNLIHLSEEQMKYFIGLTDNLRQALDCCEYGQDILTDSYLSQILVFINSLYQSFNHNVDNIMPELVRNIMAYVEENLTKTITLEQLSEKFYLNGAHISRQFKKHTGLCLRSYILDQRIALAKTILSEGKTVSDACYLSGFYDYSNFIRSFTKSVGIAPGRYKKL
jgi:AraC-like DNA-binding protein